MPEKPRVQTMNLDDLKPWDRNPRAGHAVDQIARSIGEFGYLSMIVVQKGTNRIVAGHGRYAALKSMAGVQAVDVLVADLTDEQAARFTIVDNKMTDLSEFDNGSLVAVLLGLPDGSDLSNLGFSSKELDEILGRQPEHVDEIPVASEMPSTAITKEGDLWALDRHSIFCGDCTLRESLDLCLQNEAGVDLFLTDPPYAIYGSSSGVASSVADDKMVRPFFEIILRMARERLVPGGHAYIFCDWRSWPSWWEMAKRAGIMPKNLIVWNKGSGLGTNYQNAYELVGFFALEPQEGTIWTKPDKMHRPISTPNVIHVSREMNKSGHNAAKPVDLLKVFIENSSDEGATILDPFLGSGTAIIAAEQTGRRCYGIEIEPRYVDVSVRRWQKFTGKVAKNITRPEVVLT